MASACLAGVCETPASMLRAAGISLYPKTLGADSGIAEHAQTLGTDTGQRTLEADSGIAEHARTLGADTGGAVVGRGAIYGPADTAPLISGSVGLSQTLGFSDYGGALGEPQTFQETSDTRTSTPPRVSGFSRTHPPTPLGFGRRDGRGNGAMTPLAQAEGVALLPAGILRLRAKLRHASTQGLGSGGGAGGFVSGSVDSPDESGREISNPADSGDFSAFPSELAANARSAILLRPTQRAAASEWLMGGPLSRLPPGATLSANGQVLPPLAAASGNAGFTIAGGAPNLSISVEKATGSAVNRALGRPPIPLQRHASNSLGMHANGEQISDEGDLVDDSTALPPA
eukprot:CAMPEP_0179859944 /NCGR_PEP_ID=MMETSP0982-20121206/13320_1 /TAXON_ID=483367 /ORGANISM="non described non described, Strain CCMP 2436" /LENGTH=343 /DNA_ID=CAMNT_0021747097 /DNA_START=93 /DNA_END=1122 /DNA_ORIENTATION=-